MQILAIDAGNSRLSIALYEGGQRIKRMDSHDPDEVESFARSFSDLDACAISRVSRLAPDLEQRLGAEMDCPLFLLNASQVDFDIHYEAPEKLGTDRIANAIGARLYAPEGAIVVDMGTATHFDIIDEKGSFYGGPILAGLETFHQALGMRIPHLPQKAIIRGAHVIAENTIDAMNAGTLYGMSGAIERIVREIRAQIGDYATILTGGSAPFVREFLSCDYEVPDLTLEGLREYAALKIRKMRAKYSA